MLCLEGQREVVEVARGAVYEVEISSHFFSHSDSYSSETRRLILMSKHLVFTHSATEAEVLHSSLELLGRVPGRVPWCLAGEVWLFDKLRGH